MDIRHAQRELQDRTILVVHEATIVETALLDAFGEPAHEVTTSDKYEDNI